MNMTTPAEMADILKIEEREVEALRRRHRWPHVKAGRKNIRFTDAQVAAIIAIHTVEAPASKPGSTDSGFLDGQTARSKKRAS